MSLRNELDFKTFINFPITQKKLDDATSFCIQKMLEEEIDDFLNRQASCPNPIVEMEFKILHFLKSFLENRHLKQQEFEPLLLAAHATFFLLEAVHNQIDHNADFEHIKETLCLILGYHIEYPGMLGEKRHDEMMEDNFNQLFRHFGFDNNVLDPIYNKYKTILSGVYNSGINSFIKSDEYRKERGLSIAHSYRPFIDVLKEVLSNYALIKNSDEIQAILDEQKINCCSFLQLFIPAPQIRDMSMINKGEKEEVVYKVHKYGT